MIYIFTHYKPCIISLRLWYIFTHYKTYKTRHIIDYKSCDIWLTGGPLVAGRIKDKGVKKPLPREPQTDVQKGGAGVHAPCRAVPRARGCPVQNKGVKCYYDEFNTLQCSLFCVWQIHAWNVVHFDNLICTVWSI